MTAFPDNAMMTTLRKLITHEKSARSIGSIEEAESFAAKIQELMFKHKLAMTDVEYIPYHVCNSNTVTHKIYRDDDRPSHLLLPVIPLDGQLS